METLTEIWLMKFSHRSRHLDWRSCHQSFKSVDGVAFCYSAWSDNCQQGPLRGQRCRLRARAFKVWGSTKTGQERSKAPGLGSDDLYSRCGCPPVVKTLSKMIIVYQLIKLIFSCRKMCSEPNGIFLNCALMLQQNYLCKNVSTVCTHSCSKALLQVTACLTFQLLQQNFSHRKVVKLTWQNFT